MSLEGLTLGLRQAAIEALNRGAEIVAERARDLAPIRRAATESGPKVRFKTATEVKADREMRRRVGLGREYIAAPRTRLRSRRGMTKAKIIVRPRLGGVEHGTAGGRLRSEIAVVGVAGEGSRFRARVISPTPYAKFQEFGTRHNPAHPYLRPALHESRSAVVNGIRSAMRDAIRGKEVEVVVEV